MPRSDPPRSWAVVLVVAWPAAHAAPVRFSHAQVPRGAIEADASVAGAVVDDATFVNVVADCRTAVRKVGEEERE